MTFMWSLDNRTPFAADRTWVRDVDGHHHWVVAVKATYRIGPRGELVLSEGHQLPLLHEPEWFGEPGRSSIRYEADLIAGKPGTDVIVNAHAHAPGGTPASEVSVALRIQGQLKVLSVLGERYYRGLGPTNISAPAPFISCPIRYELAFGGADSRNPIGRGVSPSTLRGQPAHQIEYPGRNPARAGPAGFGALASYWSPRRELGGTYDRTWELEKRPLLPDDYDPRCLLCSPVDQRPPAQWLRGGERIELVNMTPSGFLAITIPSQALALRTQFGRESRRHQAQLATVVIDPEESRVLVVWHSSLPVTPDEIDALDRTIIEIP